MLRATNPLIYLAFTVFACWLGYNWDALIIQFSNRRIELCPTHIGSAFLL
jgi:hypothetical protein